MSQTLFDRIWALHEVSDGLLYIDLHLVHEVTSPQAFDGLRLAGRPVRRPDRTLATADHNVPTDGTPVAARIRDELSRVQVETLERNCEEFGIPLYSMGSDRQGIVHVIGPELGVTQPGMTIVCGDSHTATHGAFGALAFGIGTSEVEHVLATQCLAQGKPKSMRIRYEGEPGFGVTAKDLILGTIGQMGTNGAAGHVVEYAGPAIEALSMEGRMTICNMTIEGGGRAGMIAPDDTTFEYLEGRPGAPQDFDAAVERWRELRTDDDATFDRDITVDAAALSPLVTWGTTPAMVVPVTDSVPDPQSDGDERALKYMGLEAGTRMQDIHLDRVFIGSCTNSRIGDLRAAAALVEGRKVASSVNAMVVPGSQPVAAPGRGRGARRRLPRRRLRLALGRLLDVPGDEPRHPPARRALRLDLEPQLRGPPGPRRAHAPRLAADGRRRGDRRATSSTSGSGRTRWSPSRSSPAPCPCSTARTSTPTRSSPSSSSSGSSGPASASSSSTTGRRRTAGTCRPTRSSPPGRTSARGSSREHAPWALEDYGFRAVVAASFADIFFSNCTKCGLLPVVLPEEEVRALMQAGEAEVDLEALEVRFDGRAVPFELDAETRRRLLAGLDDIAIALEHDDEISAYEAERERSGPVTTAL